MSTHRRLRFRAVVSAVLALLVGLAGCTSAAPKASQAAAPQQLTKVRVAFNPGTALRLYAALSADLFKKHGLDVQLVQFESGAATNAAFASGGVDLGFAGIPGILATRLAAKNNKVIMIDNDGWKAEGLVVTPKSGITAVKDLRGKTIGTVIGTTSWVGLVQALKKEGIPQNEVTIKNVAPGAWVPAFKNNDVDGIWGWAPLLFEMESAGGKIVATDSDYVLDPLLWQVRGDFLTQNSKAVEGFIAAYDEASGLVDKRDPKFIATMQEKTGVSKELVEKTISAIKPVSHKESVSETSPYSLTSDNGLKKIIDEWAAVLLEQKILQVKPDTTGLVEGNPMKNHVAKQ